MHFARSSCDSSSESTGRTTTIESKRDSRAALITCCTIGFPRKDRDNLSLPIRVEVPAAKMTPVMAAFFCCKFSVMCSRYFAHPMSASRTLVFANCTLYRFWKSGLASATAASAASCAVSSVSSFPISSASASWHLRGLLCTPFKQIRASVTLPSEYDSEAEQFTNAKSTDFLYAIFIKLLFAFSTGVGTKIFVTISLRSRIVEPAPFSALKNSSIGICRLVVVTTALSATRAGAVSLGLTAMHLQTAPKIEWKR